MKSFYSGCIRSLAHGEVAELCKEPLSNYSIRHQHNIPAVAIRLRYLRYRMYIIWKTTRPIAYLNKKYIHDHLELVNAGIRNLQAEFKNYITQKEDIYAFNTNRALYNCIQYRKNGIVARRNITKQISTRGPAKKSIRSRPKQSLQKSRFTLIIQDATPKPIYMCPM